VLAKHRQTHKPPGPRFETMPLGDEPCPVVETPIGRVGLLVAAEGYVPEVARSLMLRGAEILLWAADDPSLGMTAIARTRADENRVYVACAAAPTATGATMIVAPSGGVLAEALEGRDLAVSATVNRALTRLKERAPGTDVVRARQPETYGALVQAQTSAAARMV
jgi:predicted amidohydrolase